MGVAKPYAWESKTTVLKPEEKVLRWRPDHHARRGKGGEHVAYICEDKQGGHIIVTQKIPLLAEHINKLVGDRSERISVTSLYNGTSNEGTGLNAGFTKYRWRIRVYPLDKAVKEFENNRHCFESATVLGTKACLQTVRT